VCDRQLSSLSLLILCYHTAMRGERDPGLDSPDGGDPKSFQWSWPPVDLDVTDLGASTKYYRVFTEGWTGKAIRDIMTGASGRVDIIGLTKFYRTRFNRYSVDEPLTFGERGLYESLRDSMEEWFYNAEWVNQPTTDIESSSNRGVPEDSRFHRLLIPAHLLNRLTKIVEQGDIADVGRDGLIEMSAEAYRNSPTFLSAEALTNISAATKRLHPDPRNGFDVDSWVAAKDKNIDVLGTKARTIRDMSYQRVKGNLKGAPAAGLYFMKSVVAGVMQEWHSERMGIADFVPPIAWQVTDGGYSLYNFKDNTNNFGDMHTNNSRFPFQKYVSHQMRVTS